MIDAGRFKGSIDDLYKMSREIPRVYLVQQYKHPLKIPLVRTSTHAHQYQIKHPPFSITS